MFSLAALALSTNLPTVRARQAIPTRTATNRAIDTVDISAVLLDLQSRLSSRLCPVLLLCSKLLGLLSVFRDDKTRH